MFILPVLALVFHFIRTKHPLSFTKSPILILLTATIIAGYFYCEGLLLTYRSLPLQLTLSSFSMYIFILIFPFLLINLQFKKRDYRDIIDKIVPVVIIAGGMISYFEMRGFILMWFNSTNVANYIGKFYHLIPCGYRPIGIMAEPGPSASLIGACTLYFYIRKIIQETTTPFWGLKTLYKWCVIAVGVMGVFISQSIIVILAFSIL